MKPRPPSGNPYEVQSRADYEVSVILKMGFPGYFLVVSDFIKWAKEQGIRVGPGRGSGAGSIDRKSTRLNSSHVAISYAVFCLKNKTGGQYDVEVCRLVLSVTYEY